MDTKDFVKPAPISDSISVFLRNSILSGKLKPSERINEREIAEILGVSRSPIREALRDVAKEGLITLLPRRGAIVSELSKSELLEIFEIREMMECYAITLIRNNSIDNFDGLSHSLDRNRSLKNEIDIYEYLNNTIAFHLALVRTAGNSILYRHYQVLSNSLRRYQLFAATIPSRMDESITEHAGVFKALIKGKYEIAETRLRKHLEALKSKMITELDLNE